MSMLTTTIVGEDPSTWLCWRSRPITGGGFVVVVYTPMSMCAVSKRSGESNLGPLPGSKKPAQTHPILTFGCDVKMTLYQADLSPYAARVRIQLRAKGIEEKVRFTLPPGGMNPE
jgi:hypothetical protein